jgi:hypothetical protein
MGTYYIKPTGMEQKELVNLLKDIETAFGGTNSGGSITIQTTVDATKWYDTNVTVSGAVSAGSAFLSSISTQVAAGVKEVYIPSVTISLANSLGASSGASTWDSAALSNADSLVDSYVALSLPSSAASVGVSAASSAGSLAFSQGRSGGVSALTSHIVTPGASAASVISAGGVLNSGISALVAGGMTGGFASFLSHLSSKLASAAIT